MAITAAQVKALREATGLGMMECKKALEATGGDQGKAIEHLRKLGAKAAEKKAGRATSQGGVGIEVGGGAAGIVDLACETDFVSRGETFQALLGDVVRHVLANDAPDLDGMLDAPFGDATLRARVQSAIQEIGENIQFRRFARFTGGGYGSYVHHDGSVGALVRFEGEGVGNNPAFIDVARRIAMHVASANPLVVRRDEVPADLIDRERGIFAEQVKDKPENIRANIVEGMLAKRLFAECVLLEQPFVMDDKLTIKKVLDAAAKEAGGGLSITSFARFAVGGDA